MTSSTILPLGDARIPSSTRAQRGSASAKGSTGPTNGVSFSRVDQRGDPGQALRGHINQKEVRLGCRAAAFAASGGATADTNRPPGFRARNVSSGSLPPTRSITASTGVAPALKKDFLIASSSTSSAPSAVRASEWAGEAVPITWSRLKRANRTARRPTVPPAPCTMTRWPGTSRAASNSICHAVTLATGSDAACTKSILFGMSAIIETGATLYSA